MNRAVLPVVAFVLTTFRGGAQVDTVAKGLPYDEPRISKMYWQDSRILQTPVKSPSVWGLFSINGELQALWTGPKVARKLTKDLFLVRGYAQVRERSSWKDPGTKDHRLSGRPGDFRIIARDGSMQARFSANRHAAQGPIFISYRFREQCDFRYRLEPKTRLLPGAVKIDRARGYVQLDPDSLSTFHVSVSPKPKGIIFEKGNLIFTLEATDSVLITLDGTPSLPEFGRAPTLADAWLATVGSRENDPALTRADRVRVESGIHDFDAMFDASIDAIDNDRFPHGVVIAGPDNEFYWGSWLRDGTYSITGYELATSPEAAEDFYRFWIDEGGFSQFGEAEAQQPAIALLGLWFHSRRIVNGTDFIARVYPYVARWAEYYLRRLEKEVLLNVYEEWIACKLSWCSWPSAEIYAGLRAATRMAQTTAHRADAERWGAAADRLRDDFGDLCYDSTANRFIPLCGLPGTYRRVAADRYVSLRDDRVDAGMFNVSRLEFFGRQLGVIRADDPRFAATQAWINKVLLHSDYTISRFDAGDEDFPMGNWPVWPIISSWAAQVEYLRGRTDVAWRYLLDGQVRMHGYDAQEKLFQLPEQWNLDGTSAGTTRMLTWSHGEFLSSAIILLTGLDTDVPDADAALWPSLPPETDHVTLSNLFMRGYRLSIDTRRAPEGLSVTVTARRQDRNAPESLSLRIGEQVFTLQPNASITAILPTRGRPRFAEHQYERAAVIDRILLGQELPADLRGASPETVEQHILESEKTFMQKHLPQLRRKHFEELIGKMPRAKH